MSRSISNGHRWDGRRVQVCGNSLPPAPGRRAASTYPSMLCKRDHKAAGGEESGGSTTGPGSANFLHKRSDGKYLKLCRPYGPCCSQSTLLLTWKAAADNCEQIGELDVPSKLHLWTFTLTLHVTLT